MNNGKKRDIQYTIKTKKPEEIIEIRLLNIKTGDEHLLHEKPERSGGISRCSFMNDFTFGEYNVQLRLDWGDINDGEPILDGDIWTIDKMNKKHHLKGSFHHTKKELDNETGRYVYTFKFNDDIELILGTKKTIRLTKQLRYCVEGENE